MAQHCLRGADGQVSRVAAGFGLVATAGEMASAMGVLPWPEGEAERGAARYFADWLKGRGGIEAAEEREAIATVRRFIEAQGGDGFEPMGDLAPRDREGWPIEQRTINRVGFRRRDGEGETEYLALPEAWKAEICAGLDAGIVARVLAKRGFLKVDASGKYASTAKLPSTGKTSRVYVLRASILGDAEGDRA